MARALAAVDGAARIPGEVQGSPHGLAGRLVDQGADQDALTAGISDAQRGEGPRDPADERFVQRLMDDQPPQGRASLPGGPRGREDDGPQGQLQVGRRGDDQRVVPAQLEQAPSEPRGHLSAHGPAHQDGPGGRDQRETPIAGDVLADLAAPRHDRHEAGGRLGHPGGDVRAQAMDGQRAEGRLLRGLPGHRVAAGQRDHRVPGPDGGREVERRDHADRSERVPLLHHPVGGTLAGDRQAVELAREADGKVADVDPLLDLAERLGPDLADLQGHERGEFLLLLADRLADPADQLATPGGGYDSPAEEGLGIGRRGSGDVARVSSPDGGQRLAVDRRAGLEGLSARP